MKSRGLLRGTHLCLEADAAGMPAEFWSKCYYKNWTALFAMHAASRNRWRPVWAEAPAVDWRWLRRFGRVPYYTLSTYDLARAPGCVEVTDYRTGVRLDVPPPAP